MINSHANFFSDIKNIFPDQIKVFDLSRIEVRSTNNTNNYNSLLHKHFKELPSAETLNDLVLQIADHLKDQDQYAVYSFFYNIHNPSINTSDWFISSAKLNRCNKGLAKELVIFSYNLDWLKTGLKKRLYGILEDDEFFRTNFNKVSTLTKTEKKIIAMLNKGMNSQQIADARYVSVHTVNTHRKNINAKLDIQNFAELLKFSEAFELTAHE